MVSTSSLLPISPYSPHHLHQLPSATIPKWGFMKDQYGRIITSKTRSQAFQVVATSNVPRGNSNKEIIMVDPLEAKRLAAKQMQQIQAKEKLKRRRQIEAINGAWAMIGLTAGLVIEGQSGKSILQQLAGYLSAIVSLFIQ